MNKLVEGRILPRSFYLNIVIRLIVITLTAFGLALTIIALPEEYLILTINLAIIQIIEVYTLYRYIARFDSDISRFLINIKHNEYSDSISTTGTKRGFDKFRDLLNELNEIIEQKSLEIQESEILFKEIISLSPGALIVCYKDGRIKHVNPATLKLFGLTAINNLNDLNMVACNLGSTINNMEDGISLKETYENNNSSISENKFSLVLHKAGFISDKEHLSIISIQDIRDVEINQEIESWQKIIRVIRHEIMNSLSPIPALVGSLRDQISDKDGSLKNVQTLDKNTLQRLDSGLDTISSSSKSLISFISKYRQLTSLPQPVKQHTDIISLIESCLAQLDTNSRSAKANISFFPENKIYLINIDPDLIRMAIANILKNALESVQGDLEAEISINIKAETYKLLIVITDNGKGVPEEIRENIFIPFFTTKDAGSGIGLSVSRQIIAMHKGGISLVSTSGTGTTFKIELPSETS